MVYVQFECRKSLSDEVLNSQHYKHSQSTEASDQYANTLQIIYLKTGAH